MISYDYLTDRLIGVHPADIIEVGLEVRVHDEDDPLFIATTAEKRAIAAFAIRLLAGAINEREAA